MKQQFNTQEECLLYFEKLRWGKQVSCPYCFSIKTHRSKSEMGRHFCYSCVRSFSVLIGTIFEDTRLELPKWILLIREIIKSDGIISARSLSENFGITIKTAWLTAMKIRCAMIDGNTSLHGLLTMDSNYVNLNRQTKKLSKYFPVKANTTSKIKKIPVCKPVKDMGELTPLNLIGLLKHYVRHDINNPSVTIRSYDTMDKALELISHKHIEKNKGIKNKSLKDNYWSFIKMGVNNESKSLSAKYLPFYLLDYEYKFKRKEIKNLFPRFMKDIFSEEATTIQVQPYSAKKHKARA